MTSNALEESLALGQRPARGWFAAVNGPPAVPPQEAPDTSTPMGKAVFTIIGAMAELERNVIRERIVPGLDHAGSRETKSGAAIGRPHVVFDRAAGWSWREIATELSASVRSVRRVYVQGVAKPFPGETGIGDTMKRVAMA